MKNTSVIIYSVLIFILSLLLFQAIFYALGIVLLFLVFLVIAEIFYSYRRSPMLWSILKTAINIFLSAALTMSVYIFIFLPIDFCLTDVFMVTPKFPPFAGILFLIIFITLFSFIGWQKIFKKKGAYILVLFVFFLSGIFFLEYRDKKRSLEYLPKIYKINNKWGIQGMIIRINGVNLFPAWKKGQVIIGDNTLNIISWDEKEITGEISVPTNFGLKELTVARDDNLISNSLPFEFRDPSTLNTGY